MTRNAIQSLPFSPVETSNIQLPAIPEALKILSQWVNWRATQDPTGKVRKRPYSPQGEAINPTDPAAWRDFDEVAAALEDEESDFSGLGFSISESDSFTCIDLDACTTEEGEPNNHARKIIQQFNSYTERSPSGTGFHIWIKGNWAGSPRPKIQGKEWGEIYSKKRYMTVTGKQYGSVASIENRQTLLDELAQAITAEGRTPPPSVDSTFFTQYKKDGWQSIALDKGPLTHGDEIIIQRITGSEQGEKFADLMKGNLSAYNDDPSAADLALLNILCWWTKGDTRQMNRIFCASELASREKGQRADYLQRTINKALEDDQQQESTEEKPLQWPEPQPLIQSFESAPYPVETLPESMSRAVQEVQSFVQAPLSMVASSALAALSLAASGHVDVARPGLKPCPCALFLLTLGESGDRKSTCDGHFSEPLRAYERGQRKEKLKELQQYEAAKATWEAERAGIVAQIKSNAKSGKDSDADKARLAILQTLEPKRPKVPQLFLGDATQEALGRALAEEWPVSGIIEDEGGIILGSHTMNPETVSRTLSLLNKIWDGASHKVKRQTAQDYFIEQARLTVGLMVQRAPLMDFLKKTGGLARGNGFLARFLIAIPESLQGTRPYKEAPKKWPHLTRFNQQLRDLLEDPLEFTEGGTLSPVVMKLNQEAAPVWTAYLNEVEEQLGPGGHYREIKDVASKSADNAARLAALFQLFEDGAPYGWINADNMRRGVTLARWYLEESRRFFGELAQPEAEADAARLEEWLLARHRDTGTNSATQRDAQRTLSGVKKALPRIKAAAEELEQLDRIRIERRGKSTIYAVNPALLSPLSPLSPSPVN